MVLITKSLKDCNLEIEALPNDNWLVKFTSEGYEWLSCVLVRDGRLLQSSTSLSQMRLENGILVSFSYIEEQEQEQRIFDAIRLATQS